MSPDNTVDQSESDAAMENTTSTTEENNSESSASKVSLDLLSELTEKGKSGAACVRITGVSELLTSKTGWKYRRLTVADPSMSGVEILISDESFGEWEFRPGDHIAAKVRSSGVDSASGRLTLFYLDFLGPLDETRLLYELSSKLRDLQSRSSERMKPAETVYQISAREARSLLELVRLWTSEGKPQHYTKWCQMHQIVATNLFYMGLVKRTGSMSGYYYPTEDALDFFEGKKNLPKKKVFTRGKDGRHVLASEEGEAKSFSDYLQDYADRDEALREYHDALRAYAEKKKKSSSS